MPPVNAESALALLLVLAFGWALRERMLRREAEDRLAAGRREIFDARTKQRIAEDRLDVATDKLAGLVEREWDGESA